EGRGTRPSLNLSADYRRGFGNAGSSWPGRRSLSIFETPSPSRTTPGLPSVAVAARVNQYVRVRGPSATTRYSPGVSQKARYAPRSFVVVVRKVAPSPVAPGTGGPTIRTRALATGLPSASRT